ncbi:MAG: hypothetical protein AB1668_05040 [Nanoarchaeota archaeon]
MNILSLLGVAVIVLVLLFFSRVVSFLAKALFVILLALLVLVLFFGISFNQVLEGVTSAVLWGF